MLFSEFNHSITCDSFPCGLVVKNLPANAGDAGLISSSGRLKIPWRRKWQPTPVFLPGKFPWMEEPGGSILKELDTTEQLHFYFSLCVTKV